MPRSVDEYLMKIQLQVQNDRALKQLTTNLEKTAKAAPRVGAAMKPVTTGTRNFGHAAQNAGYQLQDFIVQVQGGVSPMRAMSQQLPQLTVGLGAWGAAIGVVAAALPALIQYMTRGDEATTTWSDSLSDLEEAMAGLGDVSTPRDFQDWIEGWNRSTEAIRKTRIELLQFQIAEGETAFRNALESMSAEIGKEAGVTFADNYVQSAATYMTSTAPQKIRGLDQIAEQRAGQRFADTLGVNQETAGQIKELFDQYSDGEINVLQLRDAYISLNTEAVGANQRLFEIGKQLEAQAKIYQELEAARNLASGASGVLPGGTLGSAGGDPAGTMDKVAEATVSAGAAARIAANDYKQMQLEAEKGYQTWEQYLLLVDETPAKMEAASEGFSLTAEGLKLFDQSFDTTLNGVLMGTRSMSDAFTDMAKVIIAQLLKLAAYQSIGSALSGAGGVWGQIGSALLTANADGNAFSRGSVVPFAKGGVVTGPTVFPMANGMGLMGEAGPEAVMPLSRGRDGKLGVSGGGMNVTINNMAAGVEVNARRGDDGLTIDVVMRQISQAIARGGNDVSAALEGAYSLGRGRGVY